MSQCFTGVPGKWPFFLQPMCGSVVENQMWVCCRLTFVTVKMHKLTKKVKKYCKILLKIENIP